MKSNLKNTECCDVLHYMFLCVLQSSHSCLFFPSVDPHLLQPVWSDNTNLHCPLKVCLCFVCVVFFFFLVVF